jgi:integrase
MASIHQHRNRWRVKWRDENGRQLVDSYATKEEAEEAARRVEARTVLDGRPPVAPDDSVLTLSRWWDRWEPGRPWRVSSRKAYASRWTHYIKPVFGRVPIDQITTADIRKWHRRLEAKGLAPASVAAMHGTLSMVLQGAVEDELLTRNPARTARLPKTPTVEPVALDPATSALLLATIEATTPGLAMYAYLIAGTGLRRAEAAGLTWDRVDLDGGTLRVDRQLDWSASRLPAWSPTKTTATRTVPLTADLVERLRAHRAAQPVTAIGGDGLVFTRPNGAAWGKSTVIAAFRRSADKLAEAGTPLPEGARGWHSLRHTVASRLLEAGITPAEAADLLGHSPEMLLSTYAHVVDRSAAQERLRAALGG